MRRGNATSSVDRHATLAPKYLQHATRATTTTKQTTRQEVRPTHTVSHYLSYASFAVLTIAKAYNNYEGFDFLVSGPYQEFPLRTSGAYTGGKAAYTDMHRRRVLTLQAPLVRIVLSSTLKDNVLERSRTLALLVIILLLALDGRCFWLGCDENDLMQRGLSGAVKSVDDGSRGPPTVLTASGVNETRLEVEHKDDLQFLYIHITS